jgi:hypothetical protein
MKYRLNAYFAVLLVTVAGASAALVIVHVATTDIVNTAMQGTEGSYAALRQSILKNRGY